MSLVLEIALAVFVSIALPVGSAFAQPALHRCASAPDGGRLAVSEDPGPGCDGAAILARDIYSAAERRFPRALPRSYDVITHSPPADASPSTFRFRCAVRSRVVESRRFGHPVRVTSARCANGIGSRFRYSFTMA